MENIIIVGGGAAGMMTAALLSCENIAPKDDILLLEKNERMGKKVYITGKGRCNLTNACDREEFMRNIVSGERFLYSAFSKFSNYDVMDFFEERGLVLKTERGNRVFPESDRAQDVIDTLEKAVRENGVKIRKNACVAELMIERNPGVLENIESMENTGLQSGQARSESNSYISETDDKSEPAGDKYKKQKKNKSSKKETQKPQEYIVKGVRLTDGTEIPADKVLVATGGLSYPSTGSTGDGYRFARAVGHCITKCYPSLVAFRIREKFCADMAGVSLKNIAVTIEKNGNVLHSEFGEMLFTHTGVSGPVILTASSLCGTAAEGAILHLDFKPALDEKTLDDRLLKEFSVSSNRQLKNVLRSLLPASVVPVFAGRLSCGGDVAVNSVTKEQRREISGLLKDFTMEIPER